MPQKIPETQHDYDKTRIIERPDGFYWLDKESGGQYGPFATLWEAVQDMEYSAEPEVEADADLQEVEDELGISDWVDPETGELAEETFTHLEDH
jgi:hypothetical protein